MYDIKATVTKATETDVKLSGNWPTECLQAPGNRLNGDFTKTYTR
jgi:hypothetical protein